MRVTVVTIRGLTPFDAYHRTIYCGRPMPGLPGHPLGNPFRIGKRSTPAEREECLRQYREWLDNHPERDKLLAGLAALVQRKQVPLSCWCGNWPENPDLQCHAVELAKRVQMILEANP